MQGGRHPNLFLPHSDFARQAHVKQVSNLVVAGIGSGFAWVAGRSGRAKRTAGRDHKREAKSGSLTLSSSVIDVCVLLAAMVRRWLCDLKKEKVGPSAKSLHLRNRRTCYHAIVSTKQVDVAHKRSGRGNMVSGFLAQQEADFDKRVVRSAFILEQKAI
jgi:hypothetical protein